MMPAIRLELALLLLGQSPSDYFKFAKEQYLSNPDDALEGLSPMEKHNFYSRLSDTTLQKDPDSLAGILLKNWLSKGGDLKRVDNKQIKADRFKNLKTVKDHLREEDRKVFLSQKKAFISGSRKDILGIKLRIEDPAKYNWDGLSPLDMEYIGVSCEIVTVPEFISLQSKILKDISLTDDEKYKVDVFTSLHTSGIKSEVTVQVTKVDVNKYKIQFLSWKSYIKDNYNWNNESNPLAPKHLTLFNPDYNNPFNIAKPVQPGKKSITIYHKNALEVEGAGLAKAFNFESESWNVTDSEIIKDYVLTI